MAGDRVKRLKDLMCLLERLPQSADREWLLREVRSRAVDVDTGVTPRALLPVREPEPLTPRLPTRQTPGAALTEQPKGPPAVLVAAPASAAKPPSVAEQLLFSDERLSLEDSPEFSPAAHAPAPGDRAVPPWTLGLRG